MKQLAPCLGVIVAAALVAPAPANAEDAEGQVHSLAVPPAVAAEPPDFRGTNLDTFWTRLDLPGFEAIRPAASAPIEGDDAASPSEASSPAR